MRQNFNEKRRFLCINPLTVNHLSMGLKGWKKKEIYFHNVFYHSRRYKEAFYSGENPIGTREISWKSCSLFLWGLCLIPVSVCFRVFVFCGKVARKKASAMSTLVSEISSFLGWIGLWRTSRLDLVQNQTQLEKLYLSYSCEAKEMDPSRKKSGTWQLEEAIFMAWFHTLYCFTIPEIKTEWPDHDWRTKKDQCKTGRTV